MTRADAITDQAGDAAEEAADKVEWVGRAGWIAKGIVYGLVGVLFVQIALGGGSSKEANQSGAVEAVADSPVGFILLTMMAGGLALYIIWRMLTVVLPGDWTGMALLERIGYAVSVVVYSTLLISVVGILRSPGGSNSDSNEDRRVEGFVKDMLAMSAGRVIVIILGLVIVGIGIAFAHKGWTRSFRDQMVDPAGIEGTAIDELGRIGWIARGMSMGLIGIFLARAAWQFNAEEAAGLDDSVRQLTDKPGGALLAGLVGLGFICYGLFAALSARHRILAGPTND